MKIRSMLSIYQRSGSWTIRMIPFFIFFALNSHNLRVNDTTMAAIMWYTYERDHFIAGVRFSYFPPREDKNFRAISLFFAYNPFCVQLSQSYEPSFPSIGYIKTCLGARPWLMSQLISGLCWWTILHFWEGTSSVSELTHHFRDNQYGLQLKIHESVLQAQQIR